MSFVSLATLTFHRRHELESRIKVLDLKCDRAIDDLTRMKSKAHGFTQKLNCDSSELKERFLMLMKTLDEYTYLVTDFNLAISQMDDFNNFEFAPVQNIPSPRPILKALPPALTPLTPTPHTPILMPQVVTTPNAPLKPLQSVIIQEYTPTITSNTPTTTSQTLSLSSLTPSFIPAVPCHNSIPTPPAALNPLNLIDALSESTPSTSCTCSNNCPPEKQKQKKVPKDEQVLIAFSSSNSSESVTNKKCEMDTEEDVNCEITEDIEKLNLEELQETPQDASQGEETCRLPAAPLLKADHKYKGTIMSVDGTFFWVITASLDEVMKFMNEMTDYYMSNSSQLSEADLASLTICAYYDDDSECFYRALYLKSLEDDSNTAELFVVDTGELRTAPVSCVQHLAPQYCTRPPYARCCHLAGLDLQVAPEKMKEQEALLKTYIGKACTIEVDDDSKKSITEIFCLVCRITGERIFPKDIVEKISRQTPNTSESIGVYVHLATGQTINEILVQRGVAVPIDKEELVPTKQVVMGPPEIRAGGSSELEENLVDEPEYEDPVVAVTGYHNRDEADICKHYNGGPEKTCFKGKRCTKRHIVKHPDGWTLDRVEVPVKLVSVPLPAPGDWLDVVVTSVCHFDRLYVQLFKEDRQEELPQFGVVLPPTTLKQLQRDLNSHGHVSQLKPLTLTPSPGELVLAMYPMDHCWYRARVLSVIRSDQSVEIMYVDYGTVLFVKEDQIRQLDGRFTRLPAQAVMCVLAGVVESSRDAKRWIAAKRALTDMVQDKKVAAHVISRDFDEITVELIDEEGYNVAQQLAALELVKLEDYSVIDDAPRKLAVP